MTQLLTRNTDLLKQEVHKHITTDAVVQGSYWQNGRGCFIRCLTHSSDPSPLVDLYGLPLPLIRIAEQIFETLPLPEAKQFFAKFPHSIEIDGKDLSLVHWAFLAETLKNLPLQPSRIQVIIDPVLHGLELLASGGVWEEDAAMGAATTAAKGLGGELEHRAARETAALAAESAVGAQTGASAAAGAAAGEAAANAHWSAEGSRGAGLAARDAENRRQRDSLLRLIREAPVVTPSASTSDRDPWKHRSGGMQCTSCMWFAPKLPDLGSPEWRFPEPGVIEVPAFRVGRCRRHAPTMNGYPVVFVNDWCGDHKLNENWQQSNEVQL